MKRRKRIGRIILSFMLTLAMVMSLMPGMGLTAKAETTFNPASSYTGFSTLASGDDTVKIDGVKYDSTNVADWYVLGYDNSSKTITLLSKQSFGNKKFNSDSSLGNTYASSEIKTYVEGLTGENQPLAGIKDALADISGKVTGNPDNISGAVPYLLSYAEANDLSTTKKSGAADIWWLRSPGSQDSNAACVYYGSAYEPGNFVSLELAVRPALKLDLSKVTFDSTTNTFTVGSATETYTVTWKSQDGTGTYETDNDVAKNTKPSYDGSAPTKAENNNYTYTFAGWATSENQESGTAASNLPAVTDNVTYYAAFSKTQKQSSTAYDDLNANDITVQIEGVKIGDTIVDWYVIGYNSTDKTVTLLSKQGFASKSFNNPKSKGHDYVGSDIETYVKGLINDGQPLAGIKDALANISGKVTGDPSTISGAVPYLLSYAEANVLSGTKKSGAASYWWLRSPGSDDWSAACVYGGGAIESGINVDDELAVRPALKLNLSKVTFDSDTKTFTVGSAKEAQTITASDVTATYGDTDKSVSATVTVPPTGGGAISYAVKSGSENYIDVASDGKLTIKKVPPDGKAYVTVTAAATDTYAQATKDVTVTINTKTMTVNAENVNLTVDGHPHGITVNVTDPASGATVKYGTGEGSYTLDASPTQTEVGTKTVYYQVTADNYTTYTGSATVTVSDKSTQTITASDVTATFGETGKKVEATTNGNGAISYAVKDGSGDYIGVDSDGKLTIKKVPSDGKAYVTVTASETNTGGTGDNGYAAATKDVTVNISKATVTITAKDQSIYVGGTVPTLSGADFYTVTGLVGTDTLTTAPTLAYQKNDSAATPDSDKAGIYNIVPSNAEAGSNYTISYVNGTLTISEKQSPVPYTPSTPSVPSTPSTPGTTEAPATPSQPVAYTVPVENDETVNVGVKITDDTAVLNEITDADIDRIVNVSGDASKDASKDAGLETKPITIDLSGAGKTVTTLEISTTTLGRISDAISADNNSVDSLKVTLSETTVTFDKEATVALSKQAEGDKVRLVVDNISDDKLNSVQKASLVSKTVVNTFEAYVECNGKRISNFGKGTATVEKKIGVTAGRNLKHYHMVYLNPLGSLERLISYMTGGKLCGVMKHFSEYAVVYDESTANETGVAGVDPNVPVTPSGDASKDADKDSGSDANASSDASSDAPKDVNLNDEEAVTSNGKTVYDNGLAINSGLKIAQEGSKIKVSWGKVSGASKYEVYVGYCGKSYDKKPIATTKASCTITKIGGKKLNLKKNYKIYVVAYKVVDGKSYKLAKTVTGHIVGRKNKKYSNPKSIKLTKSTFTIATGKTATIKAKVTLVNKKRKSLSDAHAPLFRYASSDKSIATVDSKGKITAVKAGTCYVYVYAKNGYAKKAKVTVK